MFTTETKPEQGSLRIRGYLRRSVAATALACGVALLLTPALAIAAEGDAAAPATTLATPSKISVVETPDPEQGPCLPFWLSLSVRVSSSANNFVLTVIASAPLCEPSEATAVIYSMPGNGVAWPQQLAEAQKFTISQAGTTVITFSKDCLPVQFDVVTGATPPTIRPTGPWPGPMLFPLDTATAQQYWGFPCPPPTTASTTTTSTTTTTTTVPVSVLPATTVVEPTAAVLAATQNREPPEQELAFTGSTSNLLAAAGLSLILMGSLLLLVARRPANEN
ncbi:hypothetical protein IMCC26207_1105 [Actinobacteria bacterium IMCC26207]|nr:hypothetical protein IMCC26207_1105 [Actinobacteria bacterium IMCC26207]